MAGSKTTGGMGKYAAYFNTSAVESVAGTPAFTKIETGMSVYDKIGWLISRVEWAVPIATFNLMLDNSDAILGGLTMSNALTSLGDYTDDRLYFSFKQALGKYGTAASGFLYQQPVVSDFSTFPEGGILILPQPLYLGVQGVSLASAATVTARVWYKAVTLNQDDYTNLVQSRQLLITT